MWSTWWFRKLTKLNLECGKKPHSRFHPMALSSHLFFSDERHGNWNNCGCILKVVRLQLPVLMDQSLEHNGGRNGSHWAKIFIEDHDGKPRAGWRFPCELPYHLILGWKTARVTMFAGEITMKMLAFWVPFGVQASKLPCTCCTVKYHNSKEIDNYVRKQSVLVVLHG